MSKRELRKLAARTIVWVLATGLAAVAPRANGDEPAPTPSMNSGPATAPTTQSTARFVITDFGAAADGKTLNTQAIQKLIDHAAGAGGGTVVVPAGTFLTGAIFLKPGVGLEVLKDGVLKGSTDVGDYPMTLTRVEGHFQQWLPALVNAEGVDHLRIGGAGTLDGSGTPFYAAFRAKIAANRATANLDVPRPRMVFISNCADVHVSGLHFLNSGFWNLHVYHSHDVDIDGLDISAPTTSPSCDGMDIDSSQNITIHGCHIVNNDDGIALKGSKGPLAMDDTTSPPVEHIHVYDCVFGHTGSMVTCGSEATIVRDVEVDHCKTEGGARNTLTMMRLKLRTDTPQLYENIRFHDITLDGGGAMIGMAPWTQYEDLQGHAPPVHTVKDISVSNITGSCGSFGAINPNKGDGITNLTLENIDVQLSNANGARPRFTGVTNLVVKNVKINGAAYTGQ